MAPGPLPSRAFNCAASAFSGSTSACAFRVSISTARRACSGFRESGRMPIHDRRRCFEIGDALAQDGNEITHHMHDRLLHAEEVGIKVLFRNPVAKLTR